MPSSHPLQQEGSWRLNRSSYYQEGWLATGNARAIAGVTFTSSHSRKHTDLPVRTNYNLRGHRSQVRAPRPSLPPSVRPSSRAAPDTVLCEGGRASVRPSL